MENLIVAVYILSYSFITVLGEAEVHVRLEYYSNPDGTLSNGHCCDGWPIRCATNGGCDFYFRVCLDEISGPDNTKSCKYGYHRSEKVADNMNEILFADLGDTFGGVPNPIVFKVPDPVDGRNIRLKIDVKECDALTKGDYVDYFSKPIKLFKGIYPELHIPLELESRTRLVTAVTIKCAENWYGKICAVKCAPPGENSHYTCDAWTGKKICHRGWVGKTCSRKKRRKNSRRLRRRQ